MGDGGGAPSHAESHGALLSSHVPQAGPDRHPPSATLLRFGPQTTSFCFRVFEKVRKLETFPPNVSLLNHALMYIPTSPPPAIKTHTQICPPKSGLKIDIVLKQTHRSASQDPDFSQNDKARYPRPSRLSIWEAPTGGQRGKDTGTPTGYRACPPPTHARQTQVLSDIRRFGVLCCNLLGGLLTPAHSPSPHI